MQVSNYHHRQPKVLQRFLYHKFLIMKTILVPTDFSKASKNAAEYAVQLAGNINAKIILFHAFQIPVPTTEVPVMVITPDEFEKENEARLKKEVEGLKRKNNIEIEYLTSPGFAVDEILTIEKEKNIDLIVMGMSGAGKISEALIGSITTATLRKATTPVLIIPEKSIYKNPEKIVFAFDYDPRTDAHTLDALMELMKTFDSKIYIVNVKQKKELVSVEAAVTGLKLEGKLSNVEHVYYFPENKDLVEGINEFVQDKHADMVAVIPHRYNLLDRLFHTSISKKMAFHTYVPLLALPDKHKSTAAFLM